MLCSLSSVARHPLTSTALTSARFAFAVSAVAVVSMLYGVGGRLTLKQPASKFLIFAPRSWQRRPRRVSHAARSSPPPPPSARMPSMPPSSMPPCRGRCGGDGSSGMKLIAQKKGGPRRALEGSSNWLFPPFFQGMQVSRACILYHLYSLLTVSEPRLARDDRRRDGCAHLGRDPRLLVAQIRSRTRAVHPRVEGIARLRQSASRLPVAEQRRYRLATHRALRLDVQLPAHRDAAAPFRR